MKRIHGSEGIGQTAPPGSGRMVLDGYRLLRLQPGQWRAIAGRLSSPFLRRSRIRGIQARAWQAAIAARDCSKETTPTDCGGGLCA